MTRLQGAESSFNCRKNNRKQNQSVTTTKVYETRSGGLKRRRKLVKAKNKPTVYFKSYENCLKLRRNIYLKRMETSLLVPLNNEGNFRLGDVNLPKVKKCNEDIVNDATRALLENTFDGLITSKLNMDAIDSNCMKKNSNFGNISIPKDILSNDMIPKILEEKVEVLQNGDISTTLELKHEKGLENGNSIGLEHKTESNGFLNKEIKATEIEENQAKPEVVEKEKDLKKRKTQFELHFTGCNEIGVKVFTDENKRNKKIPNHLLQIHSVEKVHKKKKVSLPKTPAEKTADKKHNSIYTIKGEIKKKPGRKPRSKGPFFHYLDLYENRKALSLNSSINNLNSVSGDAQPNEVASVIEVSRDEDTNSVISNPIKSSISINSQIQNLNTSSEEIKGDKTEEKNPQSTEIKANTTSENNFLKPLTQLDLVIEDNCIEKNNVIGLENEINLHDLIPKKIDQEENIGKRKRGRPKLNRLPHVKKERCSLVIDSTIQSILGYRKTAKNADEVLVLFENGTSNWLEQDDLDKDPILNSFFQYQEHNSSIMNRLPYKMHIQQEKRLQKVIQIIDSEKINFGRKMSRTIEVEKSLVNCLNKSQKNTFPFKYTEEKTLNVESTKCKEKLTFDHKEHQLLYDIKKENHNSEHKKLNISNSPSNSVKISNEMYCSLPSEKVNLLKQCSVENSARENMYDSTQDDSVFFEETSPSPMSTILSPTLGLSSELNNLTDLSNLELNELCSCVISSKHIKLYPYELNRPIIARSDGEFMHIYLKHFSNKHLPEKLQRMSDGFDLHACTILINVLEECEVSDKIHVVVIAGVEEFFSHSIIFEKLLKNSAINELKFYEKDVSMLRYLIQMIRNFTKPIVAVVKKSVTGLPASMLSLFDMVFNEQVEQITNLKQTPSINSANSPSSNIEFASNDSIQNFLFPRIFGLAESNEAKIMGTGNKLPQAEDLENVFDGTTSICRNLKNSVRHMRNNGKLKLKTSIRCRRSSSLDSDVEIKTPPRFLSNSATTPPYPHRFASTSHRSSVDIANEEELVRLKAQLDEEKNRYMSDLQSYLRSIHDFR